MLSRCNGTLSKRVPNPSSFVMFEQNIASVNISAVATISVSSCSPTFNLIGALARKTRYGDLEFPLSELLHQFASENVVRLKPPCSYLTVKSVVPAS